MGARSSAPHGGPWGRLGVGETGENEGGNSPRFTVLFEGGAGPLGRGFRTQPLALGVGGQGGLPPSLPLSPLPQGLCFHAPSLPPSAQDTL